MLLGDRILLALSVIPLFISATIGIITMSYLFHHLGDWVRSLLSQLFGGMPEFLHYLYYPMLLGTALLVILAVVFLAYVVQSVVAVPFYSLMAERTLVLAGAREDQPFHLGRWTRESLHMLRVALVKAFLFLSLGALLFLLSFVPVVNVFAVFGALLLMAFDLLDYSFEAMRFGLRRRLRMVARHKRMWAGMAAALGLTTLVPGLTLILAPGAVIGAALIFKECLEHGPPTASS